MPNAKENFLVLSPIDFKNEKSNVKNDTKYVNTSENKSMYNPLTYCRTCANMDSSLVPIFKEEGLNYCLNQKIEKYLPIQVSQEDDLPVQLCYHCASTLIAWDTLILGCVEAEKKLNFLKNSLENKQLKGVVNMNEELAEENMDSDDEPLITKKNNKNDSEIKLPVNLINSPKQEVLRGENNFSTSLESVILDPERRKFQRENKIVSTQEKKVINESFETEYECLKCGASTTIRGKKIIKCSYCKGKKNFFPSLQKCPLCERTYDNFYLFLNDLYSHLLENVKETNFKSQLNCKVCMNDCKTLEKLVKHVLQHVKLIAMTEKLETRKRKELPFKPTCGVCGKAISSKYAMKRHMATHTGEKKFTCHHCGKQYAQESGLQRHVLVIHEGVRKYKCPICSQIFNSNSQLKSHQGTHSDPRPFQCDQCGRTFTSQKHLYHHRKYHHTVNGMRQLCKICNRFFSSSSVLKRHHKVIHLGLKEFQCHVCSAQLTTKHYLQEHLKLHSSERSEVCSFCGKTFQMSGNLRQHLKIHMSKTQICHVCGKGFTRRCHLIIHLGSHRGVEHPRCEYCRQAFMLKSDLEKHIKREEYRKLALVSPHKSPNQYSSHLDNSNISLDLESNCSKFEDFNSNVGISDLKEKTEQKNIVTKEKRFFRCDICKKVFNRRFNFERHLVVHSGETFTCYACGKQYRRQSVLDRHIKIIHQQIRLANLACNYCSKMFSSTQSLEDHFRTHTGERPFICEVCGKDFRARPNLIAHKKIHTGELPFSCTLCDYRCRLKSTFVDHCQRHEGTRSCLCSICGKGFVNKYDLMKHKKTHSKERLFSCTFCSLTFVMKRYLKVHLKTHAQKIEVLS